MYIVQKHKCTGNRVHAPASLAMMCNSAISINRAPLLLTTSEYILNALIQVIHFYIVQIHEFLGKRHDSSYPLAVMRNSASNNSSAQIDLSLLHNE